MARFVIAPLLSVHMQDMNLNQTAYEHADVREPVDETVGGAYGAAYDLRPPNHTQMQLPQSVRDMSQENYLLPRPNQARSPPL